jgi:AcrR family transcriptional regulator
MATTYGIERAALALFVERGFDVVTTEQIADASGVSVRTFFRHFPEGKQGVLLLETRRGVDLLKQALHRRPPQEPALVAMREAALETVRVLDEPSAPEETYGREQAMHLFSQIVAKHPDLLARMMGERQLLMEGLVGLVALRMSADPNTDVRPRLLVHAADAAIAGAWFIAYANPELDRGALLEEAFEILASGMGRCFATSTQ